VKPAEVERTDQKKNAEEKRTYTYILESATENKKRLGTDLLTDFVRGASKGASTLLVPVLARLVLVDLRLTREWSDPTCRNLP
jgi:hypothetical protein